MNSAYQENLEMLIKVASHLTPLLDRVVFLGGTTVGLLITDTAAPQIRPTIDVDVIVEVLSRSEYYKLEGFLRTLGFTPATDGPVCRWLIDKIVVDIMPTDEKILGFSNRWYSPAIMNAAAVKISTDLEIRVVTTPYFLATKIEAFYGRGKGDYLSSHDIEDIITLIDGRAAVVDEIRSSSVELQEYLFNQFRRFLSDDAFIKSISGHLLPDEASQMRRSIVLQRLNEIAEMHSGEPR